MFKVPLFRKLLDRHGTLDPHLSLLYATRGPFLGAENTSWPDVAHLSHIDLLDFAVADEAVGRLLLGSLCVPTDLENLARIHNRKASGNFV